MDRWYIRFLPIYYTKACPLIFDVFFFFLLKHWFLMLNIVVEVKVRKKKRKDKRWMDRCNIFHLMPGGYMLCYQMTLLSFARSRKFKVNVIFLEMRVYASLVAFDSTLLSFLQCGKSDTILVNTLIFDVEYCCWGKILYIDFWCWILLLR